MTTDILNDTHRLFRQREQLIDAVSGICQKGDYQNAETLCLKHLESSTLSSTAHYLLGLTKICQNQMDQARVFLEAALMLEPRNETCCKILAEVYLQLKLPALAAGLYKYLLSICPNDEDVIGWLNQHFSTRSLDRQIHAIRLEAEEFIRSFPISSNRKVLYGPSFSIYAPCRVHDFLLSQALCLRGATIVPLTLVHQANGQIVFAQEGENGYYGGVWGGYSGDPNKDQVLYEKHKRELLKADELLWKSWCGLDPISAAGFIRQEDRIKCHEMARSADSSDYGNFYFDSLPVGQWAADTLFNNETIVDPAQIRNFDVKFRSHVVNVLLLISAYDRILDSVGPDVIVTNDTFYYTWAVLEALAHRKHIPCYNHWQGSRPNGWCYNRGQASMELDLSAPWQSFRGKPLQPHQAAQIEDYLNQRRKGAGLVLNTACPQNTVTISGRLADALSRYTHKTLLCTNAIWDLAALNKQIVFDGMVEWIGAVIEHYSRRPDRLLVIKAHPAETNPHIPQTRQSVREEIGRRFSQLPENVIFVDSDAEISVYQIMEHINLGLVYTTTTGLEMACAGLPVITAARSVYRGMGFTMDPRTRTEYFEVLDSYLGGICENGKTREAKSDLAKKFFYLYYFRYFCSLNLFESAYKGVPVLYVDTAKELLPGVNPVLDYVSDAVLNNKPIIAVDRLAPEGCFTRNINLFKSI